MSTSAPAPVAERAVPLAEIERCLAGLLKEAQQSGEAPVMRASLSNLVIFCKRDEVANEIAAEVPAVVAVHPARVLLLVGKPGPEAGNLTASVAVRQHAGDSGRRIGSEQITLRADGRAVERLPYVVRTLVIGDLPINLWWVVPEPPPLAGPLLFDLAEHAEQVVYDSIGWTEPAHGVIATAAWLARLASESSPGRWRVAADLNWRRLKYWRRLTAQALDPGSAPGALASITEVLLEHGPHAVVQAWELAGWLVSRLGWRLEQGRVQQGAEVGWQLQAAHGSPRLRLRRLADGPSEIRRVRVACTLNGKPGALNLAVEGEHRLSVLPEGLGPVAARTVTVQRQGRAELVGQQLSDRERDPVFQESMALAKAMAQLVLGMDGGAKMPGGP
jgi:glucose-6-phosphate dehydrogenase assembly protein OpcA